MLSNQPLTACPLCSASLTQDGYRILKGYEKDHLVSCRKCEFYFSLLDPTPADYERVYGNYDYVTEDARETDLNIANEREIVRSLSQYRSTGKVLDLAAGAGRFLERFREAGFECYATEFSPPMCDYLRRKGFIVYSGGLNPEGALEGAYDIVVFTEIIEHINNPRPTLNTIARLLRPGGALYLTTPNFSSVERRIIGPSWGMLTWPEHITYWTPKHLDQALRNAGLKKVRLDTVNVSPYRIVQALKKGRMAGALSGVSEHAISDAAQQKVAGSRLLRAAKALVNTGLKTTGLGTSIHAVYVKA